MKTLKLTLAVTFIAASALAVATAAEALHSPRAAANAAPVVVPPAAGSPHAMGCMSGAHAPAASATASAHCKAPKKGHKAMSCCN